MPRRGVLDFEVPRDVSAGAVLGGLMVVVLEVDRLAGLLLARLTRLSRVRVRRACCPAVFGSAGRAPAKPDATLPNHELPMLPSGEPDGRNVSMRPETPMPASWPA